MMTIGISVKEEGGDLTVSIDPKELASTKIGERMAVKAVVDALDQIDLREIARSAVGLTVKKEVAS